MCIFVKHFKASEATGRLQVLVAGPGVGTGYIGLEKLTSERFVMLKVESEIF